MADFASMLKYLREREGLSQRDLAEKLNISKSTISMYEMGKRHPKFEDEEAIADFFNVDLNTLRGRRIYEDDDELYARARRIVELYKNVSPETLDNPKLDLQIKEFVDLFINTSSADRDAVLTILKSLQQKP